MKTHSIEHITERLEAIQEILEAQYEGDEGHVLVQRMTLMSSLMAESGKLMKDADFHYNSTMNSEIMKAIKELLPDYTSATVQNALVKSLAAELHQLLVFAERVNRSATHQLDCMRSQLSFVKGLINA